MTMTKPRISVKPIANMAGCRSLQAVHHRIWTGGSGIEIIPSHVLITMAKNGGLVLGAYASDGPPETGGMVGFLVGWLATIPGSEGPDTPATIKHCSHIAGVLPDWQGHGIGVRLKLAQREAVLAQGVTKHATWTYDPMYWINGRMNIHRLGAICTTYARNMYGEIDDDLNAGAPTDRCQVDWFLTSPRVRHALSDQRQDPPWPSEELQILPTTQTQGGLPAPDHNELQLSGRPLALPIPDDVKQMRQQDQPLLVAWRYFMRTVFETSFAAGYALVDCIKLHNRGWHYIVMPLADRGGPDSPWP